MGYPKDILTSRAVVRPGEYAIIPPEGLVNNIIQGIENCVTSILASPTYGANYAQYILTPQHDGGTTRPRAMEEGIASFSSIVHA